MFRKVFVGAVRHGRQFLEGVIQRGQGASKNTQRVIRNEGAHYTRNVSQRLFTRVKDSPSKGFITKHLARYAQKNLASELRRQFSGTRFYSQYRGLASKLSMYAFVGVGLSSSYTKDEHDFSGVCEHIKDMLGSRTAEDSHDPLENLENHGLKDYQLGSMIAKGCNAAVYQARLKTLGSEEELCKGEGMLLTSDDDLTSGIDTDVSDSEDDSDIDSDIEVIEDDFPPATFLVTEPEAPEWSSSYVYVEAEEDCSDIEVIDEENVPDSGDVVFLITCQQQTQTEAAEAEPRTPDCQPDDHDDQSECDLAIKMMFNYDIESNATSLYRSLEKELLPARGYNMDELLQCWHHGHRAKEKNQLPPHPNIVSMYGGFVDDVPPLPEGLDAYPDALPQRINPDGLGRNKTLFLVMKRYPQTLREYLQTQPDLSLHCRTLLLAQLVEAVMHMTQHNVAHRDLKSDNIFVEDVEGSPRVVVSDFGDSIQVEGDQHMCLPYITEEISKGGNVALLAPEIIGAQCGSNNVLDYSKSDLWSVGTLAYEIFGQHNPFYRNKDGTRLSSHNYSVDDLPSLGQGVPHALECLVKKILCKDPKQRLSVNQVSTYLHLLLWSPPDWAISLTSSSNGRSRSPTQVDLMRWILTSTAQVLLEDMAVPGGDLEHQQRALFLSHLDFEELTQCVEEMLSV